MENTNHDNDPNISDYKKPDGALHDMPDERDERFKNSKSTAGLPMSERLVQVDAENYEDCEDIFRHLEQVRQSLGVTRLRSLERYFGKIPACVRKIAKEWGVVW
jgi:hypothetical protein